MTTGLKTPNSYYLELITAFPPRSITNEAELIATQNRINYILDKGPLTRDDRDYLHLLGMLVYEYEEKHEPMPPAIRGVELLKALLEESQLQPQDLVPIFDFRQRIYGFGRFEWPGPTPCQSYPRVGRFFPYFSISIGARELR